MKKYLWVIESRDGVILTHDTDNEPPYVGEWLDLSEVSNLGKFEIQNVVPLSTSDEPNFVFVFVAAL